LLRSSKKGGQMKTQILLTIGILFFYSYTWSATQTVSTIYEVPVTQDLLNHSKFPVDVEIVTHEQSNQVTLRYALPEVLTGNTDVMEFTGRQKKADRYVLDGAQGKAKCDGSSFCEVEYTAAKMNFNWARTEEIVMSSNLSDTEKTALLKVACSFHSDPFGIIHFEKPVFRQQMQQTLAVPSGCSAQVK